ncbi:MAG: hypothetical protein ACTHOU_06255, partial [Aureliella sp.]
MLFVVGQNLAQQTTTQRQDAHEQFQRTEFGTGGVGDFESRPAALQLREQLLGDEFRMRVHKSWPWTKETSVRGAAESGGLILASRPDERNALSEAVEKARKLSAYLPKLPAFTG